jgi:hypothetical protein
VLQRALEDDPRVTDRQFQAAVAAAPYLHPRLASVEVKQPESALDRMSDQELSDMLAACSMACDEGARELAAIISEGGRAVLERLSDQELAALAQAIQNLQADRKWGRGYRDETERARAIAALRGETFPALIEVEPELRAE